jgi:hypothetical protein
VRKLAMVVAASAALVVAGCGGGDDNKSLSYSDYGKKLDEICSKQNPKIKPLGDKLTGDPANDAPVYDDIIPILEDTNSQLNDVGDPPDELKADADRLKADSAKQLDLAKQAQEQAKAGDKGAYIATVKQISATGKDADLASSKLGSKVCTED